jgi:hypothetical protein
LSIFSKKISGQITHNRRIYEKEKAMDRTSLFRINDQVYQYYLQVMIMEEGRLAEAMLPSSGGF